MIDNRTIVPIFETEDQMNTYCFQWAWNERPITRRLLFHIPNEVAIPGKRGMIQRTQNKAKGVVAGEPDFILLFNGRAVGLEGKMPGCEQSEDQIKVMETYNIHGVPYVLFYSFEQFCEYIDYYLNKFSSLS